MNVLITRPNVIALLMSTSITLAGQAEDAIEQFRYAWEGNTSYQVLMGYHQVKGKKTEDRTVKFSYKSPGWVRTDVLKGADEGAIAVYDPLADKVYAKYSWMPAAMSFSPSAAIICSLRGDRLYDGSFPSFIEFIDELLAYGSVSWIGSEEYSGTQCSVIEFTTIPNLWRTDSLVRLNPLIFVTKRLS